MRSGPDALDALAELLGMTRRELVREITLAVIKKSEQDRARVKRKLARDRGDETDPWGDELDETEL